MPSFNKIVVVGHLGRDPEIRYSGQGLAICSFSVATTDKRKDQSGEYQERTVWFKVSVFGRQAEACNQYLKKGALVYVDGKFSLDEWTDRDGQKRLSPEIAANEVQFLNTKADADPQSKSAAAFETQAPAGKRQQEYNAHTDEGDSDIPF